MLCNPVKLLKLANNYSLFSTAEDWDLVPTDWEDPEAPEIPDPIAEGDATEGEFLSFWGVLDEYKKSLVLDNIHEKYFPLIMNDDYHGIREYVASYIDLEHLPKMMKDPSADVRKNVAQRIDTEHLPNMMNDRNPEVREQVARRLPQKYLQNMLITEVQNPEASDDVVNILHTRMEQQDILAKAHIIA